MYSYLLAKRSTKFGLASLCTAIYLLSLVQRTRLSSGLIIRLSGIFLAVVLPTSQRHLSYVHLAVAHLTGFH